MQYTDVFGFKKPEYAEEADVVDLNDNMDDIDDTLYKIRRLSGLVYDATTTSSNPYVEGNYTINPTDGLMYKCNGTTYGAWDSTKWTRTDEFSELELAMQSGSEVVANPLETPTGTLSTVEIDGVVYDIPGSGGGGGGSAYTETTLWSGTETPGTGGADINLSGNISDYDMIAIHVGNSSYSGDTIFIVSNLTIGETYITTLYYGEMLGAYFTYTSDTQINIKSQGSSYYQTYTKVVGISFGSGGGSGSGYSETPLWSGTEESTSGGVTINLNGNISDYDAIVIDCGRNDGNDYRHGYLWYLISDISIGMWFLQIVNDNDNTTCYWRYTSDTSVTWQSAYSAYPVTLFSIKGLKFGGGGSSSGGTHYDTTEQVIGTWVDGRDVYRKLVSVNETWQNIGRDSYKAFAYQENWVKEIDYVTNAIAVSSEQYNANMFHVSVQVDRVNGIASAYWNMPFAGSYTSMYVEYVILEYVKVVPSTST